MKNTDTYQCNNNYVDSNHNHSCLKFSPETKNPFTHEDCPTQLALVLPHSTPTLLSYH